MTQNIFECAVGDGNLLNMFGLGDESETQEEVKVTGGSSPNYYRKTVLLPLSEARQDHVHVDLEAGDVIDSWGLNFNMGNIIKSTLRGDNKDGVDAEYALDKIIWFALREKMAQGIITHKEFWAQAKAIGLSKEV